MQKCLLSHLLSSGAKGMEQTSVPSMSLYLCMSYLEIMFQCWGSSDTESDLSA